MTGIKFKAHMVFENGEEVLLTHPPQDDNDPWSLIERAIVIANRKRMDALALALKSILDMRGTDDLVLVCKDSLQDCPACSGTGNRCGGADSPPCQVCDGVGKIEPEEVMK